SAGVSQLLARLKAKRVETKALPDDPPEVAEIAGVYRNPIAGDPRQERTRFVQVSVRLLEVQRGRNRQAVGDRRDVKPSAGCREHDVEVALPQCGGEEAGMSLHRLETSD